MNVEAEQRQLAEEEIAFLAASHSDPANLFKFQVGEDTITTAFITAQQLRSPGAYLITLLNPGKKFNAPCFIWDRHGRKTEATVISGPRRVFIEAMATP